MIDHKTLEVLKSISIFEKIKEDPQAMELLTQILTTRSYKAGQMIIKEGDLGDEMFIVARGGVEILKRTRAGDNYTVVRLKAEHKVFFGEMALIYDDRRSATVTATEDSEFLVVKKADFTRLGDEHPAIGLPVTRAISRILAERLRKTTEDMMTIFDALVNEIGG